MRTKIWLTAVIIIIFGILIGGLVYFSQKLATQNKQITDLQTLVLNLQNQLNNQKTSPQPQNLTYTNDKYNFTLTFPSSWVGYKAAFRQVNWGPIGTADSYDFGFDAQDSIFNIGIISHAQWAAIQAQGGPIPTFVGSNANYVFVYSMSQYAANDTMAARRNEVAGIVSTFKLK